MGRFQLTEKGRELERIVRAVFKEHVIPVGSECVTLKKSELHAALRACGRIFETRGLRPRLIYGDILVQMLECAVTESEMVGRVISSMPQAMRTPSGVRDALDEMIEKGLMEVV